MTQTNIKYDFFEGYVNKLWIVSKGHSNSKITKIYSNVEIKWSHPQSQNIYTI